MDIHKKIEARNNFIKECKNARMSLFKILLAYEDLNSHDNDATSKNYPFAGSFDEWLCEYDNWIETLEKQWSVSFSPTVTSGELIEILKKVPYDTQVTIDDNKYWFLNINDIDLPDDEGTYTVIIRSSSVFKTDQL